MSIYRVLGQPVLLFAWLVCAFSSPPSELVELCCRHANYPSVCLDTLSSYAPTSPSPADLAKAAVNVTLVHARKTRAFLARRLSPRTNREKRALSVCVEVISYSVDSLRDTLPEINNIIGAAGRKNFRWHFDNAITWTSAAVAGEETCMDEFQDLPGRTKRTLTRHIRSLEKLTGNALFFIDTLDRSRYPHGCRGPFVKLAH